jgi:hypothetical protein
MDIWIKLSDQIKNFSDPVEVYEKDKGIVFGEYQISLSEVIRLLSKSKPKDLYETPFLPRNAVKYTETVFGKRVYLDIPKSLWMIQYHDQKKRIGFPRLLLRYSVHHNGNVMDFHMFALANRGRIENKSEIFRFPFTNVEHSSGKVCMGTNTFPTIKELTQLETLHGLFFNSPFGDDYGAMTTSNVSMNELFSSLEEKEFNDELLVPYGMTIEEYFNK